MEELNGTRIESKKRLEKTIVKRMQTIMIGALASFEKQFSFLWSGDSVDNMKMKTLWEDARSEILSNGNNQINIIQRELGVYIIELHGYSIEIKMKERT